MNCRKLNYDFVIGGTGFTLEKGWGGRKGRLGFSFFFTVTINKLHIISDYCEHDMHLIHTKREFFFGKL